MRDKLIDCWKGLLIFLVVLGHAVGMSSHYANGMTKNILEHIFKIIYLFHMPAFFFISGMLYKKPIPFNKLTKRLLIPYFIWGILSIFLFWGISVIPSLILDNASDAYYSAKFCNSWWQPFISLLHAGGWPNGEGFRCNSVLWFLPCMFMVLVMGRFLKPNIFFAIVCLMIGGLMRLYLKYSWPWGLGLASYYLFFFLNGRIYGNGLKALIEKINSRMVRIVIESLFVVYIITAWMTPNMEIAYRRLDWFFIESLFALSGVVLSLLFVIKCLSASCVKMFAFLGVNTMGIMLMHKFIIVGVVVVVKHPLIAVISSSVFATLISCGMSLLIRRYCPFMIGEKNVR